MAEGNADEQYRRLLDELFSDSGEASLPEDSLGLEKLSTAREDESNDVPRQNHAMKLEEQVIREKTLANDETQQRIKHQRWFFYFALGIIGVPVVIASIGFICLVHKSGASDVAYAAFFASVVAEVIGLSFILGNYFFPNRYQEKQVDPKDNFTETRN